jgi:exopolysaccharide biosynthesis protein
MGELISGLCADAGAIAGVNANGFDDPDGVGNGGTILGWTMSAGELWGQGSKIEYMTIGWDTENRLIVGQITDYDTYSLRDFVQFRPALIVDGEQLITGSAGWGVQPRTAIGQTKDGKMVFAVVDGRQPGYSLGITLGDLTDILMSYGVVNAAACDGGSSSVLYYNGEIINTPSTPMKTTGRYLPNAVVVKTAETH